MAALPFACILSVCLAPFGLTLAVVAFLFIGICVSDIVEKNAQKKDPGFIVIDEVVGQWIALLPLSFFYYFFSADFSCFLFASVTAIAFIAFRIFDIWKPWPIKHVEKNIRGGAGIMLDDVIAGIYALIATSALTAGMIV